METKIIDKQTAAIWAEKLGDAYVGCYGLIDNMIAHYADNEIINKVYEASNLIENAMNILREISLSPVTKVPHITQSITSEEDQE